MSKVKKHLITALSVVLAFMGDYLGYVVYYFFPDDTVGVLLPERMGNNE